MKALLDTHTFLWFIADSPRLSKDALEFLESGNEIFISTASLWEIAIKVNIGKLTLLESYEKLIEEQQCSLHRQ
jgi:PIN domain nuclease of toxin-antitoxin system